MALIGKIRNNSWLLIVMIGLGLGGFIFMDMFSGQQSLFGSSATELANIDGRSLDYQEFNRTEETLYGGASGDPFVRRQTLFNSIVDETLIEKEAEAIGLGVAPDELDDFIFGNNPSQFIRTSFTNPQTGQINREALDSYKDGVRPEQADAQWNVIKGQVKNERLRNKLVTLVEKGIYTPTWLAEAAANDKSAYRKVAIVNIPFDALENDAVTLSDDDYSAYLKQNANKYKTDEETRRVEYIVFPVEATEDDKAEIQKELNTAVADWRKSDDDETFVNARYGTIGQQWLTKDKLPATVADTLANMSKGAVYGPFLSGNAYSITKVTDKAVMQDSAQVRHILINASTEDQFVAAEKTADSLINVIRTQNVSWDTLALRHSDDPGSKNKGGFYDYAPVNQYVPAFNDAAFMEPINSLNVIRTNFGVHLIEPLGRKGESKTYYKTATISENIVPSEKTQRAVENQAIELTDNNRTIEAMRKAAQEAGVKIETSPALKANDYTIGTLGSGQTSRDIILWAFGNSRNNDAPDLNDVSPEVYSYQNQQDFYTDKFVTVALKSIQEPGTPRVADMKEDIEPFVINMKKGQMLKERVAGKTDLGAIAAMFEDVKVDTVNGVTFGGPSVTNVGVEPALQGGIFTTPANEVSEPIIGDKGVYVVKTLTESPSQNNQNIAQKKADQATAVRSQVKSRLIPALRKNVEIDDYRARYF